MAPTRQRTVAPAPSTPPRLAPVLPPASIEKLLGIGRSRGAEFAEVYLERGTTTSVVHEDGRLKSAQRGDTCGVGVRVVAGARFGYAYSDDLDERALERAAATAALIAAGSAEPGPVPVARRPAASYYRVIEPLADVDVGRKVDLVERAGCAATRFDRRVRQVCAVYADQSRRIAVANTRGHYAEDVQDLCRLQVSVVAIGKDGEKRTGYYGGGGRVGFEHYQAFTPESVGREAGRQAVAMFGALDAPSGPQTVVLSPGWSGVLLHEAIGHGLEADFIRKKTSLYTGKVGERVASGAVTVIDDGTVAGGRGSVNVDDEGNPGERKILIENGILRGYMFDELNARLLGGRSSGSGRRQSFRFPPMPRMTNTYLAPGDHHPDDIVRSVKRGLYCRHFGGGQVDISNGNFVFEVTEAYLIEDGSIGRPVKNATLIGVGPEVLKNVSMVGADAAVDPGIGTCGKDGQMVPVGVGLPTIRIDGVTVGGTVVAVRPMV